jgi:TetR/AcrR family transcriptional repressor of nem operon
MDWLAKTLAAANAFLVEDNVAKARAIFAAVAGTQLLARSRSDTSFFDALIESYRSSGLIAA